MSAYKTAQCHLAHRGKVFHFVSYEGQRANPARQIEEEPAMWFLMAAGRRFRVGPEYAGESDQGRDTRLTAWLDANVFSGAPGVRAS